MNQKYPNNRTEKSTMNCLKAIGSVTIFRDQLVTAYNPFDAIFHQPYFEV